ncbi:MAG: hypothetical protein IPJ03_16080 [Ignavibacteriales bacterium]|nr:hypothetical protein [Ignavibacteriales bacterium]
MKIKGDIVMKELTELQKQTLKVAQLSMDELPKTHLQLCQMIWDAYEAGTKVSQMQLPVSEILADFENLLISIMSSRKCSIGSIENYYDLRLEVERINKLYSKIQEYHLVSQNSR